MIQCAIQSDKLRGKAPGPVGPCQDNTKARSRHINASRIKRIGCESPTSYYLLLYHEPADWTLSVNGVD